MSWIKFTYTYLYTDTQIVDNISWEKKNKCVTAIVIAIIINLTLNVLIKFF